MESAAKLGWTKAPPFDSSSEENGNGPVKDEESQMPPGKELVPRHWRRPPHNYVSIVRDADKGFDVSSTEVIWDQLYSGVLLHQGKQKYWVDREFNRNCFMILARELSIAWGDDTRYWKWQSITETRELLGDEVEVANLTEVCWLDISGKFDTIGLSLGTDYEVSFVVKMRSRNSGWYVPMHCTAILPDGTTLKGKKEMKNFEIEKWTKIEVCEFKMSPDNLGELKFAIFDHNGNWKSGLVVKGVSIQPKRPTDTETNKKKANNKKKNSKSSTSSSDSENEAT